MTEATTIYFNPDFDKRIREGKRKVFVVMRMFELIDIFKYDHDENIKSAMTFSWSSDLSSHYKRKASWNRKHIHRLENYIRVTVPDIPL